MLITVLVCLLTASIFANAILAFAYFKKEPPEKLEQSYDVKALLRDLASGPALIKMEYLDRSEILLRSPRHF